MIDKSTSTTNKIVIWLKRPSGKNSNNPNKRICVKPTHKTIDYTRFFSDYYSYQREINDPKTIAFLYKYFANSDDQKALFWPRNNRSILFNINEKELIYNIEAKDSEEISPLLVAAYDEIHNTLSIKKFQESAIWHKKDLYNLITIINNILKANVIYDIEISAYQEPIDQDIIDINSPVDWFENKEDFLRLVKSYGDRYTAIPQFITYHTEQAKNSNIFWISWPQAKCAKYDFSLEVALSTISFKSVPHEEDYHSWLFSEKEFVKLHGYDSKQSYNYYHVTVSECFASKGKKKHTFLGEEVLDAWFSFDSNFGELRNLQKGQVLSGSEIMDVFGLLDNLFKIKNIYLCDASRATKQAENAPGQIVFRVIMSLVYGKTFYERWDYKPFTFHNLEHGWYGTNAKLSQDADLYIDARNKIRAIPLADLERFFQEEEQHMTPQKKQPQKKQSEILKFLRQKYESTDRPLNLGELAAAVYHASKTKGKKSNDNELQQMYELLTLPNNYEPMEIEGKNTKPTFNYFLSRIVYTQFFKKTRSEPPSQPASEGELLQSYQSSAST